MFLIALGTSYVLSILGVLTAQWLYQSIEVTPELFLIVAGCLFPFVYLTFRLISRKINRPPQKSSVPDLFDLPEEPKKNEITIERNLNGAIIKYFYKRVTLKPRKDMPLEALVGCNATLKYNDEADKVSVLVDGKRVGTLISPTPKSVAKEWLRTGEPYRAVVDYADDEKHELSVALFYYRDELGRRLQSKPDAPSWRLMGVRSDDMLFAASMARRGDRVQIDLDPANGKYAAMTEGGDVLGYLPAAAANYYETLDPDSAAAFVVENEKDENARRVPRISIFEQ